MQAEAPTAPHRKPRKARSKGPYKWPISLNEAAPLLRCSTGHLSSVLRGDRASPLLDSYNALALKRGLKAVIPAKPRRAA